MDNTPCEDTMLVLLVLRKGTVGCVSDELQSRCFFQVWCCNSHVYRDIKLCMYVKSTKFNLTP
jgi:hypothetical protein